MSHSIDSRLTTGPSSTPSSSSAASSPKLPPANAAGPESNGFPPRGSSIQPPRSSTPLSSTQLADRSQSSSRPSTPDGFGRSSYLSSAILSPFLGSSPIKSDPRENAPDDARTIVSRAFVPHVAVLASEDTDELARDKGFEGGFRELLRPFGDLVQGKVTVRDSNGLSRTFTDFGVRFVGLGDGLEDPSPRAKSPDPYGPEDQVPPPSGRRTGGDISYVEQLVKWHLDLQGHGDNQLNDEPSNGDQVGGSSQARTSSIFRLYLKSLLSGLPLMPHETFNHPAACMIAISSRNKAPIEALRKLYEIGSRGEGRLPSWVNSEYLRYYVLVHDEDQSDITQSSQLFDQMKRHFGTHCHLLRIRGVRTLPSDDGAVEASTCEWRSAAEEMAELQIQSNPDEHLEPKYLVETDIAAIRTLVREMTTQSVIPTMERNISVWNNEIAAKRRTFTGRVFSVGRRWAGLGTSSRSASQDPPSTPGGSHSNYNTIYGFYNPASPQALLRKLADYAFMLRDYKFAAEIYEMLKRDFNNDKAWRYYAGSHEMALISTLQLPPSSPSSSSSKSKPDALDALLDTALYSYQTRCGYQFGALRCLVVAVDQLLARNGAAAADDAARWAGRALRDQDQDQDQQMLGPVGTALFHRKIAFCYQARDQGLDADAEADMAGAGRSWGRGGRRRKAGFWMLLAAERWLELREYGLAEECLVEGLRGYGVDTRREVLDERLSSWEGIAEWVTGLQERIADGGATLLPEQEETETETETGDEGAGDNDTMVESQILVQPRRQTTEVAANVKDVKADKQIKRGDEEHEEEHLDPLGAGRISKMRLSSDRPAGLMP